MNAATESVGCTIGIVLVNWNGWEDAHRSYRSLTASEYHDWQLIIVDNASSDQSVEMIRREIPAAILIESGANLGFAGGCNLGITTALKMEMNYIFLLNCDAKVVPDTLGQLVSVSRRLKDEAILGSVVRYFPSGKIQYMGSCRSIESGRPRWYTEGEDGERLQQDLIETDFVFGAALFAPATVFRKIGLFDERFFLNYEETDWCYRAAAAGIASYVVTRSEVQHIGSASLGARTAPLQTYFLSRNRLLFYDKHGGTKYRLRAYREALRDLGGRIRRSCKMFPPFGRLEPSTRALLLALRDYSLRRFGDCPTRVRELAQLDRASQNAQPAHSECAR